MYGVVVEHHILTRFEINSIHLHDIDCRINLAGGSSVMTFSFKVDLQFIKTQFAAEMKECRNLKLRNFFFLFSFIKFQ